MLVSVSKLTAWEMCVVLYMFQLCVHFHFSPSLTQGASLPESLQKVCQYVTNVVTFCGFHVK